MGSMSELLKIQQQDSEIIGSTVQSASVSAFQNDSNNVRELDFDELSLESCATDTNTVSSVRRQLSLEERLNILQQDHKEREKKKSNSVAGSKNLKKNDSDENNGKIFNNFVEQKEIIEAQANERESAIPREVKGEEGKYVVEETAGKEIEI